MTSFDKLQMYREVVPDDVSYWYFDENSGTLLHNTHETGWLAVARLDMAEQQLDELATALEKAKEHKYA